MGYHVEHPYYRVHPRPPTPSNLLNPFYRLEKKKFANEAAAVGGTIRLVSGLRIVVQMQV
jgi:hypothetical protein